jgi:hypothetical protein
MKFQILAVLLTLSACAATVDTADTFPMNDAARKLGPIQASFVRTGSGRGPVTIHLPPRL